LFVIRAPALPTRSRHDIKQAARELGVRYVLEGVVAPQRRGAVIAQLIDATGNHIWATA
jgi:TolB-like protein